MSTVSAVMYNTKIGGEWVKEMHIPSLNIRVDCKGKIFKGQESRKKDRDYSFKTTLSHDLVKKITSVAKAEELLPDLESHFDQLLDWEGAALWDMKMRTLS